ncbi:MAG TPA: hypothetical protein VMT59_04955, partial [Gaiellaceae bacterium]|nr:hypothetical protein [Gaiellaceae bacterium]
MRYWLAAVGLFGIASFYVTPTIAALRMPQTQTPLPAIRLPLIRFAPFSIPKLHKAPVPLPVQKAPAARHVVRQAPAARVPVLKTSVTLVAPVAKPKPAVAAKDPLANVPTLDSGVGVPVALPADPVPAAAQPQPASDPAAVTPQPVAPVSQVHATRQLQAT